MIRARASARTPSLTRTSAGGSGCKALSAWSSGCVYITTGHAASRAGWASGATVEAALKECRGDGFTCKPSIGGCVVRAMRPAIRAPCSPPIVRAEARA